MKTKKIGIDIDGVLLDTIGLYLKHYNSMKKTEYEKEDITEFNFGELINDKNYMNFFEQLNFYECELLDENAPKTINYWKKLGYKIDLITNSSVYTVTTKCNRLKFLGINFDSVIRTDSKKGEFSKNYDIIIDDSAENLEDIIIHGGRAVCYNQPWNKNWTGERVYNFNHLKYFYKKRFV